MKLNLLTKIICVVFVIVISALFFFPREKTVNNQIILTLSPVENNDSQGLSLWVSPGIASFWENEFDSNKIDSVLYYWQINPNYILVNDFRNGKQKAIDYVNKHNLVLDTTSYRCKDLPDKLYIFVSQIGDSINYCIRHRDNPYLDKNIILSYHIDSLMNMKSNTFPLLKIDFPVCRNNKTVLDKLEFMYSPYDEGFETSFFDKRLIPFRLIIQSTKKRIAKLNNWSIYIHKSNYEISEDKAIMLTIKGKDGKLLTDGVYNGERQKSNYQIGDTISLENVSFTFDSIDNNWEYLYLTKIEAIHQYSYIDKDVLNLLESHFDDNKQLIFIDFWGTWCQPCIAKIPGIKKIYEKYSNSCTFISVCYDEKKNQNLAKQIMMEHDIKWKQVFDDMSQNKKSICSKLGISFFPAYMVIDKSGKIIYKGISDDDLINSLEKATMKE